MRLSEFNPGSDLRAFQAGSTVAVWAVTIIAVALAGGSPLQIAIFSTGAVGLYAVFGYFEGRALRARVSVEGQDRVTGLASAGYANHFLESEYAAAERGRAVTLVLFGFDDFEEFTADHGRAAADAAVREFGAVLKQLTRRMNLSARYGWRADTFLSVLSNADAAGAQVYVDRVCETLRSAARALPMPSVSVGIAEFDAEMVGPHEFVQRAEEALAAARAERDRVRIRYAARSRRPMPRLQAV